MHSDSAFLSYII